MWLSLAVPLPWLPIRPCIYWGLARIVVLGNEAPISTLIIHSKIVSITLEFTICLKKWGSIPLVTRPILAVFIACIVSSGVIDFGSNQNWTEPFSSYSALKRFQLFQFWLWLFWLWNPDFSVLTVLSFILRKKVSVDTKTWKKFKEKFLKK